MAESSPRSLQDPPSSAPDENEFPFGYPTSICEDAPGQKFLCSNCHNILKKALQTLCGHRYCSACLTWIVRNNKNAICQKCKEEDPNTLGEESLLAEEKAFGDAAINKEISELRVHCVTPGCSWSGVMKDFEEHQSLCEYALIPCHTGCGHVVMRRKLADHLENGCVNNVTVCEQCQCSLAGSECQGGKQVPSIPTEERAPSVLISTEVERRSPDLHCSSLSDLQREENPEPGSSCAGPKSESTRGWQQESLPEPGSSSAQSSFPPTQPPPLRYFGWETLATEQGVGPEEHLCEGSLCKEQKPVQTETASKEKQSHSTSSASKDGCCFSEVGCAFRGSKEKIQEHEQSAVGAHMLLLLQHMRHLQGTLCPKGFSPRPELSLKSAGKSICELQMPAEPELDCFPASSVPGDESVLQQLVREKVISELENKLHVFENIVAVLNKEVESSNLEILAFRRQSELDQNIIRGLELKIAELHQCLMQKDAGLSSLHKSLLFSEQASYDGIFLWKITEVGRKLQDSVTGRTVSLYSPAFYTAKYGYKVCLRVYLNGDGTGKGTHMSLFFVVMKGDYDALLPWPFRHKVTFMLLDQNNREHVIDAFRPDLNSASFQRPVNEMNVASGCPLFLPLAKLQSPKHAYVREDTLFLKCIIETN